MLRTCVGQCSDVSLAVSRAERIAGIRAAHSEWPGMSCLLPAAVAYMMLGLWVGDDADEVLWHTVAVCSCLARHCLEGDHLCGVRAG